ncbi:hypothetical protein CVT26_012923 [Gymnopilus dilepis]|uniref:Uncharacterized protein n=1 Tax=Gymnopilus dilepis TaxID=231916 RepID=A0A409Y4B4_9AGAR|nr:hypothetical protein CVT26_012923 [Gymnopilus dilepis]
MDSDDLVPGIDVGTTLSRSFSQTWGCQMIAFILNLIFFGIGVGRRAWDEISGRALSFFLDQQLTDCQVATLGFLSTVQVGFLSHQVYVDFVQLWGERDKLDVIVLRNNYEKMCISDPITLCVTKHNVLYTVPVVILAFTQLGAGIDLPTGATANYTSPQPIVPQPPHKISQRVSSTQAGATAACDVVITSILCWVLHDARSTVRKSAVSPPFFGAFQLNSLDYWLHRSFDGRIPYQRSHEKTVRTESTINRLMLLANRSSLRAQLFDELAATGENPDPHARQLGDRCTLSMIERARASSSTAHQLPSVHISTSHRSHDQLGIVYDSDAQMVLDAELDSINLNGIVVMRPSTQSPGG